MVPSRLVIGRPPHPGRGVVRFRRFPPVGYGARRADALVHPLFTAEEALPRPDGLRACSVGRPTAESAQRESPVAIRHSPQEAASASSS